MTTLSPPDITVFDIANWFLAKAKSEDKDLKHMKLQKLVYFAYGWHSAYSDQPLFPEKIFAWRHGPVVADLYGRFKRFGGNPIDHIADVPKFDESVLEILEDVWESYAPKTDIELSHITHRVEAPWAKVYTKYGQNTIIEPVEIRNYFKMLAER